MGQLGRRVPGLQGGQGEPGVPAEEAVYTRWGRTTCPTDQGTQLLYAGRAASTPLQFKGGAANYLCLPDDPDQVPYESGVQGKSTYPVLTTALIVENVLLLVIIAMLLVLCAMYPLELQQ